MGRRSRLISLLVGVVAFVLAYMFLFPTGCADSEGPSWERCITVMGNPAFSLADWGLDNTLDILIPLAVGTLVWLVVSKITAARSARRGESISA